jgi:hypothetical protein
MQRRLIFDANELLKLFTHYTEGLVPTDAEMREFMVHPALTRMVGMWVRSGQWADQTLSDKPEDRARGALRPIHIRYEGRKTMQLVTPEGGADWRESPDAPKRQ